MRKALFLLVFLGACYEAPKPYFEWEHPKHPHAVLADGTDDPVWTDMVEVARAKWSGPLVEMGCEDPFRSSAQNDVILVPDASWHKPDAVGDTEDDQITIKGTPEEMMESGAYESIVPHELGHALGLVHVWEPSDNPESIMHTPADHTVPSTKDIENAAVAIGCR